MVEPKESRPNPDPSIRTTDQIEREGTWLKELLQARIDGQFSAFKNTLDGMDKALVLLQQRADKVPSETDIAVSNLRSLQDEKFKSIETQFKERDTRGEKSEKDSKTAIDAALLAQKETAAKSEVSINENIKQLQTIFNTAIAAINLQISDVKSRLDKGEGVTRGSDRTQDRSSANMGTVIAAGSLAAVVVSGLVSAFVFVLSRGN